MANNTSSGKSFQVSRGTASSLPEIFTHPQYRYWEKSWGMIRDCALGEIAVKEKGTEYLPQMQGQSNDEYKSYLERSTYFNMVGRTINGLVGTIFQKPPKIKNLPPKLEKSVENVTKDNKNFADFAKNIAQEVVSTGRYGVLLDMAPFSSNEPYMTGYIAENILNWKVVDGSDGKEELIEVVLREFEDRSEPGSPHLNRQVPLYRVLRMTVGELEDGSVDYMYQQHVYRSSVSQSAGAGLTYTYPDLSRDPDQIITPMNRGVPFKEIPFEFFGPWSNDADTDKPPLLDIVDLNISHYRSYAQLEHGRFYTAMPVYYAHVDGGEGGSDYHVGPNVVWEVTTDKVPGIIEYNGHGLGFLEKALDQKEQQISSLGGRMLGVRTNAVAESDNSVALKEKNERSLLLNITNTINMGTTKLMRWYAKWADVPPVQADEIIVALNQDFLLDQTGAREFRAVTMMYQDGVLPVSVLYSYFQKAEVIPQEITEEDFVSMLNDPEQFPNQIDVEAAQQGFPNAQARLDQENREEDIERMDDMAESPTDTEDDGDANQ